MTLYKAHFTGLSSKKKINKISENTQTEWCAIVLDTESQNKLRKLFSNYIDPEWSIKCHHMTIDPFKPISDSSLLGMTVNLAVTYVGKSDVASAVKVVGYGNKTNNEFPHVTLAVNEKIGGKAKDSNKIVNWTPVLDHISLVGTIQNIQNI